jgi:hypothetical protein
MALYLGAEKIKLNLDGIVQDLNLYSTTPITNGVRLLSKEGYILKDLNGLYMTTIKEDE